MKAWLLISILLATLCGFALAGREAHAFPMASGFYDARASLVEAILSVASADHVDERELAEAVELAAPRSRDWQALLLTVAAHESSLSDRIRRNEFKPWEGDAYKRNGVVLHKASGIFQEHQNLNNRESWGSTDLAVQVASGSRMLRRAYWACARGYPRNAPIEVWARYTINAYAGKSCSAKWAGLEDRMRTFAAIRGRL